jgi:hypothetical protein
MWGMFGGMPFLWLGASSIWFIVFTILVIIKLNRIVELLEKK